MMKIRKIKKLFLMCLAAESLHRNTWN